MKLMYLEGQAISASRFIMLHKADDVPSISLAIYDNTVTPTEWHKTAGRYNALPKTQPASHYYPLHQLLLRV